MGGGGFGPSPLVHVFFFTFNVKIMSKNWKRTIKHSPFLGGAVGGGGFQVSWTKSIKMFFVVFLFLFFNFPYPFEYFLLVHFFILRLLHHSTSSSTVLSLVFPSTFHHHNSSSPSTSPPSPPLFTSKH